MNRAESGAGAGGDLTHLDAHGRARMVDVGGKDVSRREAVAEAIVTMSPETRDTVFAGRLPKGDAVAVVRVAAIMGAKRTSELIPLCHQIAPTAMGVEIEPVPEGVRIEVSVSIDARTGVEMEAMTGAAIGAVTLYDMVKGLERAVEIGPVRLLAKRGGRSGEWQR